MECAIPALPPPFPTIRHVRSKPAVWTFCNDAVTREERDRNGNIGRFGKVGYADRFPLAKQHIAKERADFVSRNSVGFMSHQLPLRGIGFC